MKDFEHKIGLENLKFRAESRRVLTKEDFLQDFAREASHAQSSVMSMVMDLEVGETADAVLNVFSVAPKHVDKTMIFDAISRLSPGGLILEPYSWVAPISDRMNIAQQERGFDDLVNRFKSIGVNVVELNPPEPGIKGIATKIFPFTGRSHIKGSSVDDKVFYVHSTNYSSLLTKEVVVKFTGKEAKTLKEAFEQVTDFSSQSQDDYVKSLTDTLSLYVDGGKPGTSIIRDTAVDLINRAEQSIQLSSFLYPDGQIDEVLQEAYRRKVSVDVITTGMHPESLLYTSNNVFYAANTASSVLSRIKGHSYPISFYEYGIMHPKLLLVDGKLAFTGSHNLSDKGVKAGTKEMQVLTTDNDIVHGLEKQFQEFKDLAKPTTKYLL